jgi:type II secretory pathway pseudopilin PulG
VKLARPDPRCARRGFTIIEVVIALGLFLLGMSSILGLLAFGAALTRAAALRSDASSSVEAVIADLEETLFPLEKQDDGSIELGAPSKIENRALAGYPGLFYSAVATPNPAQKDRAGGPLEYKVEVEISWKSGGERQTRGFSTLLLRELPFGEHLRRLTTGGL